ncbi:MAG: hypothetical protein ABFD96_25355 [Armatimonadia bacterium]
MTDNRIVGIACLILMLVLLTAYLAHPARSSATAPSLAVLSLAVPCADRTSMESALGKYAERPFAKATDAKGLPIEMRVNPESQTFTLLLVMPDGMTCLLAAGRQFSAAGRPIPGQPI